MGEKPRKIVITAALPYANGDIHIGHMVEYLTVDIWSRFQNMRGHECLYICADDTHGTPIMVRARQEGITPEELIDKSKQAHLKDFNDFEIEFAHYSSTNSEANKALCYEFYEDLKNNNHIEIKEINQYYCEHDKMFLPDRFVKGTCPKCLAADQYGDNCDKCGTTYAPTDLKDVRCSLCENTPHLKPSEHVFFKLNHFQDFLKDWVPGHTSPHISKKLMEWLDEDLRDWDISRDAPYFGFEIPDKPGKYFYVWVDAPMGYVSSTSEWCAKNGKSLDDYWKNNDTEIYHCIGKDIAYFHCLFWPALLKNSEFNTPKEVFVHGFLTVNGEKMSKSKGTYISARQYLDQLSPTYLRYYYACKINSGIDDLDLNIADFKSRVDSDLIGKITNVASRGAQMLSKKMDGQMGALPSDGRALVEKAQKLAETIASHYENREYAKAMLAIRSIADDANKYFDDLTPWKLINDDPEQTRGILTTMLNLFRIMAIYLKPVLPSYVSKVEALFSESPYTWDAAQTVLENQGLKPYEHLVERIPEKAVKSLVSSDAPIQTKPKKKSNASPAQTKPAKPTEITIDDFAKLDLRVGQITSAEEIPEAKKLLKLKVNIGSEERTVFSGIKSSYSAADIVGKKVIIICNLKPRKMKFGTSEGMILASGDGDQISLATLDPGAKVGEEVS